MNLRAAAAGPSWTGHVRRESRGGLTGPAVSGIFERHDKLLRSAGNVLPHPSAGTGDNVRKAALIHTIHCCFAIYRKKKLLGNSSCLGRNDLLGS